MELEIPLNEFSDKKKQPPTEMVFQVPPLKHTGATITVVKVDHTASRAS